MGGKRFAAAGLAAAMAAMNLMSASAGVWMTGNRNGAEAYWYRWEDGSYPWGTWAWIDGNGDGTAECYYFDQDGWMAADTRLPDGSQVNAAGAWVKDGAVQTKSADQIPGANRPGGQGNGAAAGNGQGGWASEQESGNADSRENAGNTQNQESAGGNDKWVAENGFWKYRENNGFAAETWKKIDGNAYYFDEEGHMLTGFGEVDGARYYFGEDGARREKTFQLDGIWYVLDEEEYSVLDEVYEEDWAAYRSENAITSIDWSSAGKKEGGRYILDENTDQDAYLSSNGVNDMKVVCAVLGANGVTEAELNDKEKKVYEAAKSFTKKKKIQEADDYEKVIEIIQYIWKKASYVKKGTDCYTPYGALVSGKSVCEGYARSFKLLCNCVGISCYVMDGFVSSGDGHAWNGVLIDGEWYLVDTTEPRGSGLDPEFAEAMLFNQDMADQGFRIRMDGMTLLPNIRYYQECDWSEYPDMDGTSWIMESYFEYTGD